MLASLVRIGVPFDELTMGSIKASRASTSRLSSKNLRVREFYSRNKGE
jgi:hypothetical protein